MGFNTDDYTVVVRTVGERTKQKCIQSLAKVFGANIEVVENVSPFSLALKKSLEIGQKNKKKWTLVVDADVIFWEDRLVEFLTDADSLDKKEKNEFNIQPFVYDNFFDEPRLAGVHLYKTSLLHKAIEFCENTSLRPETETKKIMAKEGYVTYNIPIIVGVHDFFQYHRDIVAKGLLHAKKHIEINDLISIWEKESETRSDYQWILKGVDLFKKNKEHIVADKSIIGRIIDDSDLAFDEQNDLNDEEIDSTLKHYRNAFVYSVSLIDESNESKNEQLKQALLRYEFFYELKRKKDAILKRNK